MSFPKLSFYFAALFYVYYTSGWVPASCHWLVPPNHCFLDYLVKGQYFPFTVYLLKSHMFEKYTSNELLKNEMKQESHEKYKPLIRRWGVVAVWHCSNGP